MNNAMQAFAGSSPLARGTLVIKESVQAFVGIIPACAGNTFTSHSPRRCTWDHPRLRGEHYSAVVSGVGRLGSSPLARGTRYLRSNFEVLPRIIPACAGNTLKQRNVPAVEETLCGSSLKHRFHSLAFQQSRLVEGIIITLMPSKSSTSLLELWVL